MCIQSNLSHAWIQYSLQTEVAQPKKRWYLFLYHANYWLQNLPAVGMRLAAMEEEEMANGGGDGKWRWRLRIQWNGASSVLDFHRTNLRGALAQISSAAPKWCLLISREVVHCLLEQWATFLILRRPQFSEICCALVPSDITRDMNSFMPRVSSISR